MLGVKGLRSYPISLPTTDLSRPLGMIPTVVGVSGQSASRHLAKTLNTTLQCYHDVSLVLIGSTLHKSDEQLGAIRKVNGVRLFRYPLGAPGCSTDIKEEWLMVWIQAVFCRFVVSSACRGGGGCRKASDHQFDPCLANCCRRF